MITQQLVGRRGLGASLAIYSVAFFSKGWERAEEPSCRVYGTPFRPFGAYPGLTSLRQAQGREKSGTSLVSFRFPSNKCFG